MEVWSDRGSTCKFRNARSAFRNLHVDPLSLHNSMRNKQVEFNPYIYTLTTLSKLYLLATKCPFFNTRPSVIILRASLFAVTPSHVASSKIECQNFSYVYRSRKHWECKYKTMQDRLGRSGRNIFLGRLLQTSDKLTSSHSGQRKYMDWITLVLFFWGSCSCVNVWDASNRFATQSKKQKVHALNFSQRIHTREETKLDTPR